MSSDNKDIPDNEVVEPVDGEVDSGETESLDVETDALTEVEALQEELAAAKDAALRAQADGINAQRGAEPEIETAR